MVDFQVNAGLSEFEQAAMQVRLLIFGWFSAVFRLCFG